METFILKPESTIIKYLEKIDNLNCDEEKFEKIWSLKPEEKPKIIMFGKLIEVPRYYNNFGVDYNFSGVNIDSIKIPEILEEYIDYCKELEDDKNKDNFNWGILINWYINGENYIGYHSDDEEEIVNKSNIYCFSLGDERDFCLKCKKTGKVDLKIKLRNNSLIIMCGTCQKSHKHSIPKRKKGNRRISITIRKFKKKMNI
jgi:alkylated DNA repair dioxygenase AlkB